MATPAKAKRKPRAEPIVSDWSWHKFRTKIHAGCFLIFVVAPFFDVMRFDIPRQRFYFVGHELWISEFGIIFFSLMFLMFLIAAAAMLYGRVYCSYLCPQMIFSEAFMRLETRIFKLVNKKFIGWNKKTRTIVSRAVFYIILWIASVFLAFIFIAYFVEPRDLIGRLLTLDIVTAGGIAGAATTVITFLDFAFVRLKFCRHVCPYGYLQGILSDGTTLLVEYSDKTQECIECKKCVRVCPMEIDIRDGAHQIECIHCAECVDACEDVLNRLGKPGLIAYSWGEQVGMLAERKAPWYHRLGLRDTKRWVVLLVLLFYGSGLMVALSMRNPVLVQVAPQRDELYAITDQGEISNRFRVKIANRGEETSQVIISVHELPGARLANLENPITVETGEVIEQFFEIVAHRLGPSPGVNHFRIVSNSLPDQGTQTFEMTFIMPTKEAQP
jgi:polyferredoxin